MTRLGDPAGAGFRWPSSAVRSSVDIGRVVVVFMNGE
jgi:hypothetical protein